MIVTLPWPNSLLRGVRRFRSESEPVKPDPALPELGYPIQPAPRVAVLGLALYSPGPIRIYVQPRPEFLEQFRPLALAGPASMLEEVARWREEGRLSWDGWQYPLVVFSDVTTGLLTEERRRSLWEAFDLPIYEQLRGFGGELLAYECDAHDGFHVNENVARFERCAGSDRLLLSTLSPGPAAVQRLDTGWTGEVETGPCACGAVPKRLVGLRGRSMSLVRAATAG